MNHRIKKPVERPVIQSREQLETLVGEIAALTNKKNEIEAVMNSSITTIRQAHEELLTAIDKSISDRTSLAKDWADTNSDEFRKRRSINLVHGVLGYRKGTPKLKTLKGWKFDSVLKKLKELKWGAAYLRIKEEINKELLIEDITSEELSIKEAETAGVQVAQDETFFIAPKLEKLPQPAEVE